MHAFIIQDFYDELLGIYSGGLKIAIKDATYTESGKMDRLRSGENGHEQATSYVCNQKSRNVLFLHLLLNQNELAPGLVRICHEDYERCLLKSLHQQARTLCEPFQLVIREWRKTHGTLDSMRNESCFASVTISTREVGVSSQHRGRFVKQDSC